MRKRINAATGVPKENIMLVATHTHTSVALDVQHNQNPPDIEAYSHMIAMTVEAATEAWSNRAPVKYGHGETTLPGYSFCRDAFMKDGDIKTWPSPSSQIDRLISEVDRSVNVLRFDDAEGNIKCFVVNYANHPDSSSKQGYNPDYPGYMRELLKEKYGEDITVLYLNGAEGDVNYFDYENGAKSAGNNRTIGTALAAAVIRLNPSIMADKEYAEISSISKMHAAPQSRPTEEDMEWAMEVFNVGKVVYPKLDEEENENNSGDDSVEAENK
jgi:predicted ester cyclase